MHAGHYGESSSIRHKDALAVSRSTPRTIKRLSVYNRRFISNFTSLGGGQMFQKDLLQGKRILITGGGTGLGKATAQRFLELGAEIYICGRRQDVLAAAEQELRDGTGGKIHSRPCDVRDAA